jgi:hypothetical protein
MFSFLQRDLPAVGRVFYRGPIPPPIDQLTVFGASVTWTRIPPSPEQVWAGEATHPVWGAADIACDRRVMPFPEDLIEHVAALSEDEKARARLGNTAVAVRVHTHQKHVLRDRKRLLFWLRALMQSDGAIAVDGGSTLLWSHAMLDDELAHNAPHRVAGLTAGQRGEHDLERLTDWAMMSPEGPMTPRNISAARRLRETRTMWQARIDAARHDGA